MMRFSRFANDLISSGWPDKLSSQGIQSLHGLLAQKEDHIELARYIIQNLRGQAKGACRVVHPCKFTPDLQKSQKTSSFQPRSLQIQVFVERGQMYQLQQSGDEVLTYCRTTF